MARLFTGGAEAASGGTLLDLGGHPQSGAGTSWSSTVARTGTHSIKCDSGAGNTNPYAGAAMSAGLPATNGVTYFVRGYFRFANLPTTQTPILRSNSSASNGVSVRLTTGGLLQLFNEVTATQIGSDSATTIAADNATWYRIELSYTFNASAQISACEAQLDGVSIATGSGLTATYTVQTPGLGWITAPGANSVCYVDDHAINDSTGGSQNSWPGSGKVVVLLPTGDSAVGTGWTLGTGTAISGGSGSTAVKNVPPLGVADLAAGSDTKQLRNATSNANSNYDATMATYASAGIGSSDTVTVVDPMVVTAAPVSTSAKQGTLGVSSNPVIANVALSAAGTAGAFWQGNAAGTYATGWKGSHGTANYGADPLVLNAPVASVTGATTDTDGTSYVTGSWTPTANSVAFLAVASELAAGADYPTSIAGNGLTWVNITNLWNGNRSLAVYAAVVGGSPSAGAITVTFGTTQKNCAVVAKTISGLLLTTTPVQSVTATGSSTTRSATLAAFANPNNVTLAFASAAENAAQTVGSGFTSLGTAFGSTEATSVIAESKVNDLAPSATGGNATWGMIALEFPAAKPVVSTAPVMRITQVTSSTRIAMICFMAMMVEYVPSVASKIPYRNPMPLFIAQ